MRENKRKIGTQYETLAARYLESEGYEIAVRNYRNPWGEIDIVAKKDGTWVFCEVKFRSTNRYGMPQDAVDVRKQRRISRAALGFYARNGYPENVPCRFDVIAVSGDGAIEHIENAYDFQG